MGYRVIVIALKAVVVAAKSCQALYKFPGGDLNGSAGRYWDLADRTAGIGFSTAILKFTLGQNFSQGFSFYAEVENLGNISQSVMQFGNRSHSMYVMLSNEHSTFVPCFVERCFSISGPGTNGTTISRWLWTANSSESKILKDGVGLRNLPHTSDFGYVQVINATKFFVGRSDTTNFVGSIRNIRIWDRSVGWDDAEACAGCQEYEKDSCDMASMCVWSSNTCEPRPTTTTSTTTTTQLPTTTSTSTSTAIQLTPTTATTITTMTTKETTQATKPTKPTKPSKPTKHTKHTKPTKPTKPTKARKTTKTTKATKPTKTTKATEAGKTTRTTITTWTHTLPTTTSTPTATPTTTTPTPSKPSTTTPSLPTFTSPLAPTILNNTGEHPAALHLAVHMNGPICDTRESPYSDEHLLIVAAKGGIADVYNRTLREVLFLRASCSVPNQEKRKQRTGRRLRTYHTDSRSLVIEYIILVTRDREWNMERLDDTEKLSDAITQSVHAKGFDKYHVSQVKLREEPSFTGSQRVDIQSLPTEHLRFELAFGVVGGVVVCSLVVAFACFKANICWRPPASLLAAEELAGIKRPQLSHSETLQSAPTSTKRASRSRTSLLARCRLEGPSRHVVACEDITWGSCYLCEAEGRDGAHACREPTHKTRRCSLPMSRLIRQKRAIRCQRNLDSATKRAWYGQSCAAILSRGSIYGGGNPSDDDSDVDGTSQDESLYSEGDPDSTSDE